MGGLSPRNIIVASSNSGGGRSGGSASNRFSGSVDHEDDVEELMEWYQNLVRVNHDICMRFTVEVCSWFVPFKYDRDRQN